jgi:hypothetical protein
MLSPAKPASEWIFWAFNGLLWFASRNEQFFFWLNSGSYSCLCSLKMAYNMCFFGFLVAKFRQIFGKNPRFFYWVLLACSQKCEGC